MGVGDGAGVVIGGEYLRYLLTKLWSIMSTNMGMDDPTARFWRDVFAEAVNGTSFENTRKRKRDDMESDTESAISRAVDSVRTHNASGEARKCDSLMNTLKTVTAEMLEVGASLLQGVLRPSKRPAHAQSDK